MINNIKKKWKIRFAPGFQKSFDKCFSGELRYSIPRFFSNVKSQTRWAWQRVFRGHDDSWYWDLYGRLDEMIPISCRKIKKYGIGCPSNLYDKDYKKKNKKNECYKWEDILEKIALGFEAHKIINQECLWSGNKPKKFEKLNKEWREGMKLFVKWYSNLWD